MENLTYVSTNYGKSVSVKEKFERLGMSINFKVLETNELDVDDLTIISYDKAIQAFDVVGSPVFVTDSGFYIRSFPNKPFYPGHAVKRSGVSSNIGKLLDDMKDVEDRYCYFLDCLTYYDGVEFKFFYGKSEGFLAKEINGQNLDKALSRLWNVFIPLGCEKTLASMSDEERSNLPFSTSAKEDFSIWYKENVVSKKLKKF